MQKYIHDSLIIYFTIVKMTEYRLLEAEETPTTKWLNYFEEKVEWTSMWIGEQMGALSKPRLEGVVGILKYLFLR